MPELPEVEMVARGLRPHLLSRRFFDLQVLWERSVDRPDVPTFLAALTGASVMAVDRRGKYITMSFDSGQTLLTHLRMTGKFLIRCTQDDDPHTRVRFALDDGRWLIYSDTRKFGRMYLVDDPQEVVGTLGPEPLEEDFTPDRFAALLARRRGAIKPLLLNQSFIAGMGNIYTDEALWRARIHPLRRARSLTPDKVVRLHQDIVTILSEAIRQGGTSLRDNQYRQPDGSSGAYQGLLSVYGRAGLDCHRCGTVIERIVVGQRGTHYCPGCQESPAKRVDLV